MKQNAIQTNFTSGEISPLMYGRVDTVKYQNGAAQLTNFLVRPQGGVSRRQGTQYVAPSQDGNPFRVVPFVVSNALAYVLVFGDQYVKFYVNGAPVQIGGNDYSVTTPYLYSDLALLYFVQSADVLFIAHPNYPPQVLSRISNSSWTLVQYVPTDGPYLPVDTTGNQAQVTLTSDTCTMQETINTTITATCGVSTFSAPDVGKYILSNAQSGFTGTTNIFPVMQITGYSSTTVVTGTPQYAAQTAVQGTSSTLSFNGVSTLTSTVPVFTLFMVNQFAVITNTPALYLVTAYISSTQVTVTALGIKVPTAAVVISGGSSFTGSSTTGKYIEYLNDGVWYLAKIQSVLGYNQASVTPLANILVNDGGFDIAISGTSVTSSFSGVFSSSDIGKYVRSTNTAGGQGTWILITSFTSSSSVGGTAVSMFNYTYPTTVVNLLPSTRVVSVSVAFNSPVFNPSGSNVVVRLKFGSQWRAFQTTSITTTSAATGTLNDYLPYDLINANSPYNNGYADSFMLGAWSSDNGYPAIVGLFEQRLVWANTALQPNTIWMSQVADYYNMSPTEEDGAVIATDAINVTIAFGDVNPITWIRAGQVLLIGTAGGEYEIVDPTGNGISSTNLAINPQSYYGSLSPTIAYRFGVATLFLQRGGNKLREMLYQFQFNSFNSKDVSIISEHILREHGGALSMSQQLDPVSIFWILCYDGSLVSCTYDRDQDVVAFAEHTLQNAQVLSICTIPNNERDDLYVVVARPQNNDPNTLWYSLEVFTPFFDTATGDSLTTMQFLDCSQLFTGALTTVTISNILLQTQLNLTVVIDGKAYVVQVPNSTTLTLPVASVISVVVGLPYTSTLQTLSPDGASQIGSSQGKRKRITEVIARVKDALPFKHGPSLTQLTLIDSSNFGTDLNANATAGQLVSGDVRFSLDDSWDTRGQFFIVQDQPYPLTIDTLMPILNSNE